MLLDIVLGITKVAVGVVAHSHALVADGIHSFTDAATDIMVILITRIAHQDPDEDHPYGHGKFETLGTVILGSLLIAVAGAMAYDSIYRLLFTDLMVIPEWPALLAACLSIVGKEWAYRYTLQAGKKLNSDLLIANAWHSRTDALSSVVVLIALLGVIAGFSWLDAAATIIIAVLVAKIGWDLAWDSLKELVETSLPKEKTDEMKSLILSVEGVKGSHFLRGRYVGPSIVLDIHVQVEPKISVSEGHQIGLAVMLRLKEHIDHINDITLHIDAEEDLSVDDQMSSAKILPNRAQVMRELEQRWLSVISTVQILEVNLHYLQQKIQLDVMLDTGPTQLTPEVMAELRYAVKNLPWLDSIKFWTDVKY